MTPHLNRRAALNPLEMSGVSGNFGSAYHRL
jgi:hypothetical protein